MRVYGVHRSEAASEERLLLVRAGALEDAAVVDKAECVPSIRTKARAEQSAYLVEVKALRVRMLRSTPVNGGTDLERSMSLTDISTTHYTGSTPSAERDTLATFTRVGAPRIRDGNERGLLGQRDACECLLRNVLAAKQLPVGIITQFNQKFGQD